MNDGNDDWYPKHRDALHRTTVDTDEIVLDRRAKLVHQLNPVGKHIFECCDGARTAATIAVSVAKQFAVEPGEAREDVDMFLKKLRNLELIE